MLQYLLNTTAIWLLSLIMFDVFLRKESYHNYNRVYLLFTFLLGALLPLWQWQDVSPVYSGRLAKPIEQVMSVKENVATTALPAQSTNWAQWLTIIYITGVVVAILLLAIDIIKLASFYTKGRKSKQDTWAVIETGKEHAPFSLFNILFICSRQQYNADEWNMILDHEKKHSTLFHFADLLLMQLARIVFWFHPLVYLYNRRLLLVHEYQADHVSSQQPQVYGRFLVEQAVLQSAPALSHSFNRSPIKNRIVMLTHRSSAASKIKMLVFIPLALVCIIFFSKNSFSQKFIKNGNMITYKGNRFELSQPVYDTQVLIDPVDGHEIIKVVSKDPVPIKMNGLIIYRDQVTTSPAPLAENGSLEDHIFKGISTELNKLSDGIYHLDIRNIVIDNNGKIVFYDYQGLRNDDRNVTIPVDIRNAIDKKIDPLMSTVPSFKPGKVNGNNVTAIAEIYVDMTKIQVSNHKTSLIRR